MTLTIRPAKRSEAKPLIGLYSESGCGKTKSALLLARGFVGGKGKIVMVETESGRGEVFADELPGGYEVIPIRDNFSPQTYGEAIALAEKSGAKALIIDSASHEWEGLGGVLDMADRNSRTECLACGWLADKGDRVDVCGNPGCKGTRFRWARKGVLVWQQPKIDHAKHFMLRLMQTPIDLVIVCMRARYPMVEGPNPENKGKVEWHRSGELSPKQSDDILFELLIHGWIDHDHRFHGTKYTREDQRAALPSGEVITIETGKALAEWAKGKEPAASAELAKALKAIGSAKSNAELEKVAAKLKGGSLKGHELSRARAEFKARHAALSA